jgi:hypothetical protein
MSIMLSTVSGVGPVLEYDLGPIQPVVPGAGSTVFLRPRGATEPSEQIIVDHVQHEIRLVGTEVHHLISVYCTRASDLKKAS